MPSSRGCGDAMSSEVPQWKKELIARLRSQNRRTATAGRPPPAGQQPVAGRRRDAATAASRPTMVQERLWERAAPEAAPAPCKNGDCDSDSSEELRYGPGIVNRLRNKYLSLAQRDAPRRPSVLRKAASLEHILDEDAAPRPAPRAPDLKRTRSVEALQEAPVSPDAADKPPRVNRPKRLAPVVSAEEKPPADVVKQAKRIFERRPEQRTRPPQQTGDVAAKVATYKNIIQAGKKPPVKAKPPPDNPRRSRPQEPPPAPSLPSPIPDVSTITITSLSETPDLIITSTPLPAVNSASFRISATENFIREEKRLADCAKRVPPLQPLKLEINGLGEGKKARVESPKPALTVVEIEKNLINAAKTLEQPKGALDEGVTKVKVPKVKKPPRELENNSIVFKFTDRKEVPDYVHNDGVTRVHKIEKPKVGEGGIILLPGASIDESFTDEDEEIMRSLEGPPSPCDVTFINDNILIDGKSSLSQKTKKAKMKISFVEAGPEIYEYPSESSLLIEDAPTAPLTAQICHSVPSITGSSSLGNYTPKSTEEFQPGVTRSVQNIPPKSENAESAVDSPNELILQEVEKPVLFSAGANSDILF